MSRCKGCSAVMIWATTEGGSAIPLNPDPVAGGNIVMTSVPGAGGPDAPSSLRATYVTPDPAVPRYVAHFTTCPAAKKFRKAGVKSSGEKMP